MIADYTTKQTHREEFRELVDLYLLALETEVLSATPVLEETLSSVADQLGMVAEYTVLRHPPQFLEGSATEIITPTRTITGHYAAVELDALIPSHHPVTFSPDARYPYGCQQRDYSNDESEKLKIIKGAQQFNHAFLLAMTPSAVDGAPVVTRHGFVLGGNGRTMMLKRTSKEIREQYNWQLWRKVDDFGLPIDKLRSMRFPVLVRLVDVHLRDCALYSNILNTGMTQKTDFTTQTVSLSRQLNRQTQELIAELFEESGSETLAQFYANAAATTRLVRLLRQAEIITDQNQNEFINQSTNTFTSLGKLTVEGILLSSVLEDKQVIEAAREYTAHIIKSIPLFVRMKTLPDGWNLLPVIRKAMLLEHERRASGLRKVDFTAQATFDRPEIDPHTERVWDILDLGPRKFAAAMRDYVDLAEEEAQGGGFGFNEPRTPVETLALMHQKYSSSSTLGDTSGVNPDDQRAFLELMELYSLAVHNELLDADVLALFDAQLAQIAALLAITPVQYRRLIEVIAFNHNATPAEKLDLWSVLMHQSAERGEEKHRPEEIETEEDTTDDHTERIIEQAKERYERFVQKSKENHEAIATRQEYLRDMKKEVRKRDFPGFFPTESPVVRRMIQEADIEPGMRILEPSAGGGAIADELMKQYGKTCLIDVCEFSFTLRELLLLKGHTVVAENFLAHKEHYYDVILMNPPFEKRADVLHVKHAYKLLVPGGRIIAIMSAGTFGSSQPLFRKFVEWVKEIGYHEELPEGSFNESDTDVRTHFVVLNKPLEEEIEQEYRFESLSVSEGEYVEDEMTGQQYQVVSISGEKIVLQELETAHQIHYIAELPEGRYRLLTHEQLRNTNGNDNPRQRRQSAQSDDSRGSRNVHRDRGDGRQPDNSTNRGSGDDRTVVPRSSFKSDVIIVRSAFTWRPTEADIEAFLNEHIEVNLRKLFWYQIEGVIAALRGLRLHGGFLNADSTGTGKTAQQLALAYLEAKLTGKPALIITKSRDIISDSFSKAREFLGIPFNVYNGVLRDGVNICTYNDLVAKRFHKPMEFTIPIERVLQENNKLPRVVTEEKQTSGIRFRVHGRDTSIVIFDESHMLINKTTNWTEQGLFLVHETPHVAFYSATPLDKVEHIHYLRRTGIYKSHAQFERMMRTLGFEMRFRKTKIAEGEYYDKPYYGRIKEYPLALTAVGLENLFEDLTEDGGMIKRELSLGEVDIDVVRGTLPYQAHIVMDQIEEYWTEVAFSKNVGLSAYAGVIMQRQKTELEPYKVRHALDLVHAEMAEGRSVIVFCEQVNDQKEPSKDLNRTRRSTVTILREALEQRYGRGSTVTITGNETDEQIARGLQLFQANVKRIMLTSTTKGGTGINMDDTHGTAPRTEIIMTPPISARTNVQIIGRVARATTKTRPRVFYIFSNAAVDVRLREILEMKMRLLAAAVSGSIENLDLEDTDTEEEDLTEEKVWTWFDGVKTLVDGKKRFRKLSIDLHPDTNPNKDDPEGNAFKEMTAEYEEWEQWMKTHRTTERFGEHRLFKKEKIRGKDFDKPFNAEVYTKIERHYSGLETRRKYIILSGTMAAEITPETIAAFKNNGFKKISDFTSRIDRWEAEYADDRWLWVISMFEQQTPFYAEETTPAFREQDAVMAVDPSGYGGFDDENGNFIREQQRGSVIKVRERATSSTTSVYLYDVRWQTGATSRRLSSSYLMSAPVEPADMSEEEFVAFFFNGYTYEDLSKPQIIIDLERAEKGFLPPQRYFATSKEQLVANIRKVAEAEAREEYARLRSQKYGSATGEEPLDDGMPAHYKRTASRFEQASSASTSASDDGAEPPSTVNLYEARKLPFKPLPLARKWREVIGAVAKHFSAFIWGPPGSGKSTLLLQLCEALSRFGEVLYASAEEHLSRISERAKRLRISTRRIHILTTTRLSDIHRQLATGRYAFVAIDSLNVLDCTSAELLELMDAYPTVVFIIIAQASKDMRTYRGTADIAHKVDIVVRVYKGIASVTKNRFADLKDFPIFPNKRRELLYRRFTRRADKPASAFARTGELHRSGQHGSSSGSR